MAEQFEVRPSALHHAADRWRDEVPDLSRAVCELRSRLGGARPWGDDEPGRAFGHRYQPNADALLGALDKLVTGLGAVADGLDAMAARYEGAERAAAVDRP